MEHYHAAEKPLPGKNSKWAISEFAKYQQSVLNNLGYFAVSTTRITNNSDLCESNSSVQYLLVSNTKVGSLIYWTCHANATIKAVFLAFLVLGYFGPVVFLDKIAALDYILCFGLVVLAGLIWVRRYPFYEILQANWKVLNLIFAKLEFPTDVLEKSNEDLKSILRNHSATIWIGCSCLMIQYFADPKYCTFTYSIISLDNTSLRLLFAVHEFMFMNLAWNVYAGSCSLCIYQGITISHIFKQMDKTLQKLYKGRLLQPGETLNSKMGAVGTSYNIHSLILDYKQLMLICRQFNDWVAYKTLFMHMCGGCQFVSDVFAGTHIFKIPGTGFMDVWFYIEDCFAAGFMLVRTYVFMALVSKASRGFLTSLNEYLTFPNVKRTQLRKVSRSLKPVTLNVGPCPISRITVLTVLNTMGNYYVCAALW